MRNSFSRTATSAILAFFFGALLTVLILGTGRRFDVPRTIHILSKGERFIVPGDMVDRIEPVNPEKQGVTFEQGRQVTIKAVESNCGSSSNVTSHGSAYLLRFSRPIGTKATFQDVALPADGFEIEEDDKLTPWVPAITDAPPVADRARRTCYSVALPKRLKRKVRGGDILCEQDTCYAEFLAGRTVAMTEFSTNAGYDPEQAITYAAAFVEAIRTWTKGSKSVSLKEPTMPPIWEAAPSPIRPAPKPRAPRTASPRGNTAEWFPMDMYPPAALRNEEEGVVRVSVTVGTSGRVTDCRILQSSGYPDLDASTCRLARSRGRFNPAIDQSGREVASTVGLPDVVWKLPD